MMTNDNDDNDTDDTGNDYEDDAGVCYGDEDDDNDENDEDLAFDPEPKFCSLTASRLVAALLIFVNDEVVEDNDDDDDFGWFCFVLVGLCWLWLAKPVSIGNWEDTYTVHFQMRKHL